MNDAYERKLEDALRAYVSDHQYAMDTLEGIAEWWIAKERGKEYGWKEHQKLLRTVLKRLVAEGFLETVKSGHQTLYRKKQ